MKKLITIILSVAIITTMAIIFTGCTNDSLYKLTREFNNISDTAASMDSVDKADINTVSLSIESNDVMMTLEYSLDAETLTLIDKVDAVRGLYDLISEKTDNIEAMKTDLKAEVTVIKSLIKDLRSQNAVLTDDERAIIDAYITEIRTISVTLSDTIGKAYLRMHELKGSYTLGNIDTVLTTFTEVNDVLQIRVDSLVRLGEIAEEINIMLTAKIAIE